MIDTILYLKSLNQLHMEMGCPKIGGVTANKLLDVDCSWDTVVNTFAKQGLGEAVAIEQARLARILRNGEYDTDTGEVKLWTP